MTLRSKIAIAIALVVLQGAIVFAIVRVERERNEPEFAVELVEPRAAPALAWTTADGASGHIDDARGGVVSCISGPRGARRVSRSCLVSSSWVGMPTFA